MNITTAPRTALAALLTGSALLCAALPAAAQMAPAAPKSETVQLIETALASAIRTPEERARDARERKPVQTLEFFGLTPDMTVVEVMPGAGWYTKILGQVLAEKGKLYITLGAARLAPRLAEWKLDKVVVADGKTELKPSGQFGVFDAPVIDLPIKHIIEAYKDVVAFMRKSMHSNVRTAENVLNNFISEHFGKLLVIRRHASNHSLMAEFGAGREADESITRSSIAGRVEHDITPGYCDFFIEEQMLKAHCAAHSFGYAAFCKKLAATPNITVEFMRKDMTAKTKAPPMRVNAMKVRRRLEDVDAILPLAPSLEAA